MASKIYTKETWVDEVLSTDEAYEVVQPGGAAITNVNQLDDVEINLTTSVAVAGTPIEADKLNNMEDGIDGLDTILADTLRTEYTTGGSSTVYTLTTQAAVALAADERYRVQFHATAGATPTLNRDAKGAKPLMFYGPSGLIACGPLTIVSGMVADVVYDGTNYVVMNVVSPEIHSATNKATIVDADEFGLADSAASYGFKHVLFSVVKTTIKAYVDTFKDIAGGYAGLTALKINMRNVADSITSFLTNTNTVARTYTFLDRDAELGNQITNFSTAAQALTAATRAYLTGSDLHVPASKGRIGTRITWVIEMTKTAAGAGATGVFVKMGTAGDDTDADIISFTKPAGTAAVDNCRIIIELIIFGPLTSSCVVKGHFNMTHNLAATGFAVIPCVNVGALPTIDITTANLIFGITMQTGAAEVATVQSCFVEAINL